MAAGFAAEARYFVQIRYVWPPAWASYAHMRLADAGMSGTDRS